MNNNWRFRSRGLENRLAEEMGFLFVTSTRAAGDMLLSPEQFPTAVQKKWQEQVIPGASVTVVGQQVHGQNVTVVDGVNIVNAVAPAFPGFPGDEAASARAEGHDPGTRIFRDDWILVPENDGLIFTKKGAALGVFSADCLAVALIDPKSSRGALLHSGWRGSRLNIAARTVDILKKQGSRPENLHVFFSPSIHVCCYEVGSEFRDFFPETFLKMREDNLYFDNEGFVGESLANCGIPKAQIHRNPFCTYEDERFFSYRREGKDTGRSLTLLASL